MQQFFSLTIMKMANKKKAGKINNYLLSWMENLNFRINNPGSARDSG
jgi:hypothetical protein